MFELIEETCTECDCIITKQKNPVVAGMYVRCPYCGSWNLLCSSACENHDECAHCLFKTSAYLVRLYLTSIYDDVEEVIASFGVLNEEDMDDHYDVKFRKIAKYRKMWNFLINFKNAFYGNMNVTDNLVSNIIIKLTEIAKE